MMCLNCGKQKAIKHKEYGYLPCRNCQLKSKRVRIKESIEMVGEDIKKDRKIYKDDTIQPFRSGVFSKEYYKKYGTKGAKVTQEDLKTMKNVWEENSYYKE